MASSDAATVEEYLEELPPERRTVVSRVREVVLENLPNGFVEGMNWGMISYEIPLETYPDTYNGKPLSYIALAAQKRHYALYLSGAVETERLRLVIMDEDVLAAFASNRPHRAASLMQAHIGNEYDLPAELAQLRLSQLRGDPDLRQWLLRSIVRRSDSTLVGHIGFHSRPDPEYLRDLAPAAVELGYTVYAPYRRNGYAYEAAIGLMQWANTAHGVTDFVVSVSPGNTASLGLVHKLGSSLSVSKIGHHMDPEDGPEDIYLLHLQIRQQAGL